jgi:hypothetical protein
MTQTLDHKNLLQFLKDHYPHLYDAQMQVDRICAVSGYGDVSMVLHISKGLVTNGEILGSAKRSYFRQVADGTMIKMRID